MKILVLGASGMAGHTIAIYMQEKQHEVVTFTRKPFLYTNNIVGDVKDINLLKAVIKEGYYDVVINCIGILNKNAEDNQSDAVFLNSFLPHYLVQITKETRTKIIHMSTDCVFSGEKGLYVENSFKDGETFYDRSKALGEINDTKNLTFRNSIIGPDMNKDGIGLFNWFMKQNSTIKGYSKAIWTGVTTLTLARAMEQAIYEDLTGLYHLVNNKCISKFELLNLFNRYFKSNGVYIIKDESICIDKSLINSRSDFLFEVPSYEEMVIDMHEWIVSHKDLYPHYE